MKSLVEEVFKFLYEGPYKNKLFSQPNTFMDNPILRNLVENNNVSTKPKNEKTCDEVFYEYLYTSLLRIQTLLTKTKVQVKSRTIDHSIIRR